MKKKIAFIISSLSGGGAQRVVSNLSKRLSKHYDVSIIMHDVTNIKYPYSGELVDLRTPVGNNSSMKAVNFLRRVSRLHSKKKANNYSAVISFMDSSNLVNLLSGKSGKTILSIRNYKSKQTKGIYSKVFNYFIRHFYRKSDAIVAPSIGIQNDLVDNFGLAKTNVLVINNPCNIEFIESESQKPLPVEYSKLFSDPVLLNVGKLMPQKGQWHLIRAFSLINKIIPEMKLVILGEGPLRSSLEETVSELNLQGSVIFAGFQVNPFSFMGNAKLFILPSLFEGFPNVLVEAMACGLPVIAADCPSGPREILAPGDGIPRKLATIEYAEHGILLPTCDNDTHLNNKGLSYEEQLMADAVVKLYSDDSKMIQYREKSFSRALDYSLDNIVAKWISVIEVQQNELDF